MFSDFVIKIPYTTHPHMVKNTGSIFNKFPDSEILDKKHAELEIWRDDLYGQIHGDETDVLLKLCCAITDKKETTDIIEFAFNFEEDVVLMHKGKIQALCFCFPSGWIPKNKLGHSLTEIHSHVADSEKLTAASQRITEIMAGSDSFKRYVWSITHGGELNQHPLSKPTDFPETIDDLYFRVETQTTMPIGNGISSLFFVKTTVKPLRTMFSNIEFKNNILASLNSMSDAILDYKNLRYIRGLLTGNNF